MGIYGLTQMRGVEMGVYLCRENALVPQQLLYLSNVGSTLQQMGGKGVAECVRADTLVYSCNFCILLYHVEYHYARQWFFQSLAYEYIILISRFDAYPVPVFEICFKLGYGTRRYGYKTLFVAFSCDTYELLFDV